MAADKPAAPKHKSSLQKQVERQARFMRKAERDRPTLLGQTIYLGTLGVVLVLPVVGGAYLGRWLDELASGYSLRWTLSLLSLGVVIGAFNVYWLVKENDRD